ncbi:prephenate dehydrogenase [Streptomyces monashensis]|uniref:Prephenate dehydrogenase n=1 Tax=Streptomyces monashensis TaxID=1678012 RepID=A0A1S2QGM0_9ACTN|nr:prephenate dehydrogenase [Streptomyces monashensis]OIK04505.1 prephenate dehydrogenase [Streptomyces monashensis]
MRSAAVVGTGLIGTSIALALRGRGVTTYLIDVNPEAARTAADLGAGIAGTPRGPVDLAVIAVPPRHVAAALKEHQLQGLAHDFTDAASIKELPQREADQAGCDLTRFVGGHPMGGREQSGPLAARDDLFHGRPWVLTPSVHTRAQTVERAQRLAELCRARPVVMAHAEHDRAVALTSHVPHLVSSLLAGQLLHGDPSQLGLAGQGLQDITRLAAGSADLWTDILGSNAVAVADVLAGFAQDLHQVVDALQGLGTAHEPEQRRVHTDRLTTALVRGIQGRARIPARAPATTLSTAYAAAPRGV